MNVSDIDAVYARSQDGLTTVLIAQTKATVYPRLQLLGWVLRAEGGDGLGCLDLPRRNLRLIHSIARELDGQVWAHVSCSRRDRQMPIWEQARDCWRAVYPDRTGIVVIPPENKHVSISEVAHVWGCLTATPIPDFTHGLGRI